MSGTVIEVVPLATDADGVIRVADTRVQLETVILDFHDGATAEEIARNYPTLGLPEVYSVIAYYLHHRADVDEYVAGRLKAADALRRDIERRWPPEQIRERLLPRRGSH
jgi:uncharacterized protein (DUF433 family)